MVVQAIAAKQTIIHVSQVGLNSCVAFSVGVLLGLVIDALYQLGSIAALCFYELVKTSEVVICVAMVKAFVLMNDEVCIEQTCSAC